MVSFFAASLQPDAESVVGETGDVNESGPVAGTLIRMSIQPLFDEPFLRAQWGAEFNAFQASPETAALLARLRAWVNHECGTYKTLCAGDDAMPTLVPFEFSRLTGWGASDLI